jgi:F-type H+-transporting ATPase subunit b
MRHYNPLLVRSLFTSTQLISSVPATTGKKSVGVKPSDTLVSMEKEKNAALEQSLQGLKSFQTVMKDKAKLWNEMHEVYYGKERDFENYPVPKIPDCHPKVRFGFIPDSFFQAFYNKTGVTGPYLFIFGGLTYLLSKEILIVDHEFDELLLFSGYVFALTKLIGPPLANFIDKSAADKHDQMFHAPVRQLAESAETMVKSIDEAIHNEQAHKHVFQAKRDNVGLQLELAYRSRLDQLHKAVKARLDYQVEKENARRQFQQQHMVNWIVDNVVKGITPQQEKDILQQCIKDLQSIAQRQAASA